MSNAIVILMLTIVDNNSHTVSARQQRMTQAECTRDNKPRDITRLTAKACGHKLTKNGDIRISGYGTDRYLSLMYYEVGFTLFADNGVTPPAALSSTALAFAHKYYRNRL